jgi:hypothetical protein
MSCGSWWSRRCRPVLVVGDVHGVIIGRCWKRSPGGFAPGARGGTCRRSSGPGRRYGSGIAAGQPMAPTNWSSSACCNDKIRPDSWTGCCRSTRPSFVPISTRPVRPHTAQGAPQGARSNDKIPEPDDHGLGRSRGGLTTKVHALVDRGIHPVVVQLSPGQAGDNPRYRCSTPLPTSATGRRTSWRTRPTATPPPGANCAVGVSATPFQNVVTRSNTAKRRAQAGADHPRSTPSATAGATPSSAASAGSSNGAPSRPGTTSTPAPTWAVSFSPPSSSSAARVRRHALVLQPHFVTGCGCAACSGWCVLGVGGVAASATRPRCELVRAGGSGVPGDDGLRRG